FCIFSNWGIAQNFIPVGSIAIPSAYEMRKLEALNTDQSDFSAVPFRDGVIFTSTGKRSVLFGCSSDCHNGHYSDLYFPQADREGNFTMPQFVDGDVNDKYHNGAASFTSDQSTMTFSRNNRKGTNAYW